MEPAQSSQFVIDVSNLPVDFRVATLATRITTKLPVQTAEELPRPSIWKVPSQLKKSEDEAYEPKLVSIGPLHQGKKELLPMEEVKLSYLRSLLNRHQDNRVQNYVGKIFSCLRQVREEYSEKIELPDDSFVEMLVIDGCFIIEYLARRICDINKETTLLDRVRWGFSFLKRDLLLLENQIPFFVLTHLFEKTKIPSDREGNRPLDLVCLALRFLELDLPDNKCPKLNEVNHLLHLHHLSLDPQRMDEETRLRSGGFNHQLAWAINVNNVLPILFFGLLYLLFVGVWPFNFDSVKKSENPKMTYSATELLEAGIQFKRKNFKLYKKACALKLSFENKTLEIPFLSVTDAMGNELRNLIAFEQCCKHHENHFTSYCVFMKNLINTADDVAALRKSGVLEDMIGGDAKVADLFNDLGKEIHLDSETHYNTDLLAQLRDFCNFAHHSWKSEILNTFYRKPWNVYSSGVTLLALTAIQTLFTVISALLSWRSPE